MAYNDIGDFPHHIAHGGVILVSDGAIRRRRGLYTCKIVMTKHTPPNVTLEYMWVESSSPCDADTYYINSFQYGILSLTIRFLFMCQLFSYVDIDPDPDTRFMVYCDKLSALKLLSVQIVGNGTHHQIIP